METGKYALPGGLLEDLRGLMRIESVSGAPEGDLPFGKGPYEALRYTLGLCESYGFRTNYVGKHCGYAEIGEGDEMVGILCHLDVVPAGSGWDTPPFDLTEKDGRFIGRGISDDKGPAMLVIYALRGLLESGRPLKKRYRIIFGTSEETGAWTDMELYKNTEELPSYGFTPDGDFPLVYAEKGIYQTELLMPKAESGILEARGGNAVNIVPDECTLTVGESGGETVTIRKTGKAAHGSTPDEGENAISLAMKEAGGRFAEFYRECIGEKTDGSGLGLDFRDRTTETTVNAGMIWTDEAFVHLTLDIRHAVSASAEQVETALAKICGKYGLTMRLIEAEAPSYVDPELPFVRSMTEAYREVTGDKDSEPMAIGGGTYAKAMPKIAAFGPVLPGMETTEHQANEYVREEDFALIYRIYEEALRRI